MWGAATLAVWATLGPARIVDLEWSAPPGCPDADAVHRRIELMADPEVDYRAEGRVDAKVTRTGDGWSLRLEMRFPEGRANRELEGASCEAVTDAAALIIAVMLDPESVLEVIEEAVAEPVPPVVPEPVGDPVPEEPKPKQRRVWGLLGAMANGSFAALPAFGFAVTGAAGIGGRWFRAEAVGTYELPRTETVAQPGAGARTDLWALGARGCGVPGPMFLRVPICAGFEFGVVRARGVGLQTPRTARVFHAQATIGTALVYFPIHHLGLRLGADLVVPLRPWLIKIDDLGDVHRSRPAGIRFGAGIETRFP